MSDETKVSFEPSQFVGVRIDRSTASAEIQFAKVSGDLLSVMIPTPHLARLYEGIDRAFRKVPELDVRVSKKS